MNLHLPDDNPSGRDANGRSDSKEEKIQRIMNEKKRQDLIDRYGALFGESDDVAGRCGSRVVELY
ncbi:MAG: hypothetical protein R2867_36775 [Caldilineaceae bacterium]